jgi:hypothetical protein
MRTIDPHLFHKTNLVRQEIALGSQQNAGSSRAHNSELHLPEWRTRASLHRWEHANWRGFHNIEPAK